jgi:flagellar basal body P-ring protein FlgI
MMDIMFLRTLLFSLIVIISGSSFASRIKDVVAVEGIRDNMLMGYGLYGAKFNSVS